MNHTAINTDLRWRIAGLAGAPLLVFIAVSGWHQVVEWWPGVLGELRHAGTIILGLLAAAHFVTELRALRRPVREDAGQENRGVGELVCWTWHVAYLVLSIPGLFRITEHPFGRSVVSPIVMAVMFGAFLVLLARTIVLSWRAFFDGVRGQGTSDVT
jgi:hypothetical protein